MVRDVERRVYHKEIPVVFRVELDADVEKEGVKSSIPALDKIIDDYEDADYNNADSYVLLDTLFPKFENFAKKHFAMWSPDARKITLKMAVYTYGAHHAIQDFLVEDGKLEPFGSLQAYH